jgi:hypothetical protein
MRMGWDAQLGKGLVQASRKDSVGHLEEHMVEEVDMEVPSQTIKLKWHSARKIIPNHITLGRKRGMKVQEVVTVKKRPGIRDTGGSGGGIVWLTTPNTT